MKNIKITILVFTVILFFYAQPILAIQIPPANVRPNISGNVNYQGNDVNSYNFTDGDTGMPESKNIFLDNQNKKESNSNFLLWVTFAVSIGVLILAFILKEKKVSQKSQ